MHKRGLRNARRNKGLKFSSTKHLHRANVEKQMGRVTLCDIENTARVLEFSLIKENENVKIETQDSKQPLVFGNDDDKRISNTANDTSDVERTSDGECTSIYNAPVSISWFLCIDEQFSN